MQNSKLNKRKFSNLRTVMAVLFLIFTVYSVFYIAHESHHECSGEECPICQVILISVQNIRLLGVALVSSIIVIVFKASERHNSSFICKSLFKANTLIAQKIRLND